MVHSHTSLSETGSAATDGFVLRRFPCRANQEKIRQRQSILPPPQGPAPIPIQHDMRGSGMNRNRVAPPSQHNPGTGSAQWVCPGDRGLISLDSQPSWNGLRSFQVLCCWSTGKPSVSSLCYKVNTDTYQRHNILLDLSVLYKCLKIGLHLLNCSSINQSS